MALGHIMLILTLLADGQLSAAFVSTTDEAACETRATAIGAILKSGGANVQQIQCLRGGHSVNLDCTNCHGRIEDHALGLLKAEQEKGITILVSTPYMDEAALCDRIALIQGGKILSIDTPKAIQSQFPRKLYALSAHNRYLLLEALKSYENTKSAFPFGAFVHYSDQKDSADLDVLKTYLESKGLQDIHIVETVPSIEDTFMELVP